jgi:hypothetical protein
MRPGLPVAVTALLVAAAITAFPAPASAAGPPLDVSSVVLAKALDCHGDLSGSPATPVLLVPGTTLTPAINFSWNYELAFTATGRPWCTIALPNHAMSDAQIAGEYVVYALRTMHDAARRKISVVGFSQGGMLPRWALEWWPDTRTMVDDVIGIDPSNHGTLDAVALCAIGCAPSFWQQRTGSAFLTALNAGAETYAGISYTQVYSALLDEVVVPNLGPAASSALHTGRGAIANIAVQDICPVHVADHLTMGTIDPVGYAVVTDALTHAGPAASARISRSVCLQPALPGVSLTSAALNLVKLATVVGTQVALYPHVAKEPALAAYARS